MILPVQRRRDPSRTIRVLLQDLCIISSAASGEVEQQRPLPEILGQKLKQALDDSLFSTRCGPVLEESRLLTMGWSSAVPNVIAFNAAISACQLGEMV